MTAVEWIEENAERLRAFQWVTLGGNDNGVLRCYPEGGQCCPMSVLAPDGPEAATVGVDRLASLHGLSDQAAMDVAEAADGCSWAPSEVRDALLEACRPTGGY